VVAAVGDRTVSTAALTEEVVREATRRQSAPDPCPDETLPCPEPPEALVRRVLDERVRSLVVAEHAARSDVRLSPAEVDAAIDEIARQSQASTDELFTAALGFGYPRESYRRLIGEMLLRRKVDELAPKGEPPGLRTEAERKQTLDRAYEEWRRDPRHRYVTLQTLSLPIIDPSQEGYVRGSLAAIRERAERGDDFCKLVAAYAVSDSEREQCASPAPRPLGKLPPALVEQIEKMKPMEVTPPMRFGSGMALLRIVEAPAPLPLEEIVHELWPRTAARVRTRAVEAWLAELGRGYGLRVAEVDVRALEAQVVEIRRTARAPDGGPSPLQRFMEATTPRATRR